MEEYAAQINRPEIDAWIASCDAEKQEVYALRYTAEEEGRKDTSFAVYFPFDRFDAIETSTESGLFRKYAKVDFGGSAHKFLDRKYNFLLFSSSTDAHLALKTTYKGKSVPCTVMDVEFDPMPQRE